MADEKDRPKPAPPKVFNDVTTAEAEVIGTPKDIPTESPYGPEPQPGDTVTTVTPEGETTGEWVERNNGEPIIVGPNTIPVEDKVPFVDLEGNELTAWQSQTSPDKFLIKAKRVVIEYLKSTGGTSRRLKPNQLNIVWFSKTLQNWKALVSTVNKDGLYFEVTYNGHAGETYVDVYQKITNFTIED